MRPYLIPVMDYFGFLLLYFLIFFNMDILIWNFIFVIWIYFSISSQIYVLRAFQSNSSADDKL